MPTFEELKQAVLNGTMSLDEAVRQYEQLLLTNNPPPPANDPDAYHRAAASSFDDWARENNLAFGEGGFIVGGVGDTGNGGGGNGGGPIDFSGVDWLNPGAGLRDRFSPEQVYRYQEGIPQTGYLDPWQRYQTNRWAYLEPLFHLQSSLGGQEGLPAAQPYQDVYARGLGYGGRYAEGRRLWDLLGKTTPTFREEAQLGPDQYAHLLGLALRNQVGIPGAQVAQAAVPRHFRDYLRGEALAAGAEGEGPQGSFLEYLRSKYPGI